MKRGDTTSRFKAKLLRPAAPGSDAMWAFVILPKGASAKLPRRGKTTVVGTIDGVGLQVTLEPDGKGSHWLRVDQDLLEATGKRFGDVVAFEIKSIAEEPEPEIPADLFEALAAEPSARSVWDDTTTIARLDWIHWITSAKQLKTRAKRINDACDMLASGNRRVCCFDPSGIYSKAISEPKEAR